MKLHERLKKIKTRREERQRKLKIVVDLGMENQSVCRNLTCGRRLIGKGAVHEAQLQHPLHGDLQLEFCMFCSKKLKEGGEINFVGKSRFPPMFFNLPKQNDLRIISREFVEAERKKQLARDYEVVIKDSVASKEEITEKARQMGIPEPIADEIAGRIIDGRARYMAAKKAGLE